MIITKNNSDKRNDSAINRELLACERKLKKIKKHIPLAIFGSVVAAFIIPFIPHRRGRNGILEHIDYHYAVLFNCVLLIIIYAVGYHITKEKIKTKIHRLKLEKNPSEESEKPNYRSL